MPHLTPLVPLDLDKPRSLRLDTRAIFAAERAMCAFWSKQVNILTIFSDLGTLTLNDMSVLLHQALLHEDPTLTLQQTQELMTFEKLPAIFTAILEAWNAATMPATAASPEEQSDGPLAFPGVHSGPSAVLS